MAEKAPNEEEAGASRESFLDQFLRRLDQTDQEAAASPSTSGTSVAAPSSEYSSLSSSANPWFMSTENPGSPLNPDLQTAALQSLLYRSSAPSPYSLPAPNPLAEFPWLLEEFDHQQRELDSSRLVGDSDAHDSAQRLYSSYTQEPGQVLGPSAGSPSSSQGPIKDEPASSHTKVTSVTRESIQGHGSSSKLDAGPVPRFGEPGSQTQLGASSLSPVVSRQMNYRPPTSPLLSEAAVGAGGSVTTSAGTSNTSLSSESTSNAGDEDESEKKEVTTEGASSGKRKKPEAEGGGAGETPESKKSDQPKNKPRKRGGAKRLREPRYAIKTRTEVDVLDDGFKWRKYGQKAVKNSPHPRNYYRCTTPLCPVRKRVERSNEDAGLVITTYEGTHTHQTPGFHRPSAGGYFGDRPLGMGGGLFQSPLGPSSNLLPLPPGFDLASLQQATALRNVRGLQPNQNFPGSSQQQQQQIRNLGFQQESLFRAQQFLGLQDVPPFGSVKQEPFQFTAQDFMSRNQLPLPLPGISHAGTPGMTGGPPSQLLNRSISDHSLQRPGGSPLFTGLNFPSLPSGVMNISGPASSSNISPREPDNRGHGRRELPAGVGGSSSRIDHQSLETLVSSSGHPNFDQAQGDPVQPQPGLSISSSQTMNLGPSGSLGPVTRGGQQRITPVPTMHQQHQQSIRSGPAGLLLSSSSENLQGQTSESTDVVREGLLQDMVRHGGPKVSKS